MKPNKNLEGYIKSKRPPVNGGRANCGSSGRIHLLVLEVNRRIGGAELLVGAFYARPAELTLGIAVRKRMSIATLQVAEESALTLP